MPVLAVGRHGYESLGYSIGAAAVLAGCGAVQSIVNAPDAMNRILPASSAYKVLYRFAGGSAGARPMANLTDVNGTLYGTTTSGGLGNGTVYRVSTSGSEKVLYSFAGGSDGANPDASTLINVNGTLYGTTFAGGTFGEGTVYRVSTNGAEKVLYSFAGGSDDGAKPFAGLIAVNGNLYGTTTSGGSYNDGTIYSVTQAGKERVLHSFAGSPDGANPYGSLVNVNGTLYGTTYNGGASAVGTVYRVTPNGAESVLYSFSFSAGPAQPIAGLIDANGTLYGTTQSSGFNGDGTVYSITTSGAERVLHNFLADGSDGFQPWASLIDVDGTLYGTTIYGGTANDGTIYSISLTGHERVLHSFFKGPHGGAFPIAGLVDMSGTLFGDTTESGAGPGRVGPGIVFAFSP